MVAETKAGKHLPGAARHGPSGLSPHSEAETAAAVRCARHPILSSPIALPGRPGSRRRSDCWNNGVSR
jgi:hypothetical protein